MRKSFLVQMVKEGSEVRYPTGPQWETRFYRVQVVCEGDTFFPDPGDRPIIKWYDPKVEMRAGDRVLIVAEVRNGEFYRPKQDGFLVPACAVVE